MPPPPHSYDFREDWEDAEEDGNGSVPPDSINERVSLVFSLKELKGLISFCQYVNQKAGGGGGGGGGGNWDEGDFEAGVLGASSKDDYPIVLAWLWGGQPMRFCCTSGGMEDEEGGMGEGEGEPLWKVELTVATIEGEDEQQEGGEEQQQRGEDGR